VSGRGSALRLFWSGITTSAIKVAYVLLTAPVGPNKTRVVGLDGLPVPASFLRLMAGPGVVVEGDGVVSYFGSGYLTYGDKRVDLKPNATVVIEGRRCVYSGRATNGEPLDITVYFDGRPVVLGRGEVSAFCIPNLTRA